MTPPARVGRTAFMLGFAGLLPQGAVVTSVLAARLLHLSPTSVWGEAALVLGLIYPAVILSFLGGMWWGFAMWRQEGQGRLAALAVAPSLAALTLIVLFVLTGRLDLTLSAIGIAILLTLPVDHALTTGGEAPPNWMRLRVPLSIGLGGLTILLAALLGNMNLSI